MNWRDIVAGVRAGDLRVEYYFPKGTRIGRYRVERFTVAGGYRDWRKVKIGPAAIHRALRELYPATHGGTDAA